MDPDQKAEKPADLNLHYLQHQVYLGSAWKGLMNTPITLLYQTGLKIHSLRNLVRAKAIRGSFEFGSGRILRYYSIGVQNIMFGD